MVLFQDGINLSKIMNKMGKLEFYSETEVSISQQSFSDVDAWNMVI